MPALPHAQGQHAGVQAVPQWRGQACAEPGIAFGPGEHAIALGVFSAGRVEAMAAGEVVQPGPCGDLGRPGAVIVAAAIVEVPAKRRGVETPFVQPGREGHGIERCERRAPGGSRGRHAKRAAFTCFGHRRTEALVLRPGRCRLDSWQRVHRRQQTLVPMARHEQALLRAVAEVAVVVGDAATFAAAQAEFFEQGGHLGGTLAGQRQVVRAERASHAGHHMAAAVAARVVFEIEQVHVVDAGLAQCARCSQAGDACADDQHRRAVLNRGRGQRARLRAAQAVPAFMVRAHPAAAVLRHLGAHAGHQRQ